MAGFWRLVQRHSALCIVLITLAACADSGGGAPDEPAPPGDPPDDPLPMSDLNGAFVSESSTAHFLTQSTFAPLEAEISQLTGASASEWYLNQLSVPASLNLQYVLDFIEADTGGDPDAERSFAARNAPGFSFWRNAVSGEDQMRQRMAFALSQILVISTAADELAFFPEAVAYYQDILVRNAFGNYRDLLEEVTYSPAMGYYLTYLQNQKGDPATGRVPDENYAREIMQLFTIGLIQLQSNGEPLLNASG
ncbi:MAG: DUF1800 family protein, partial [Hyphococcus sp.]